MTAPDSPPTPPPRLESRLPVRREEFTLIRDLEAQKAWLAQRDIPNPYFPVHAGVAGAHTRIDGRDLVNFCSYNYLGLNGHQNVNQAAHDAIDRYGTTVSASRIVSGERPIHRELERELADFTGCEDALVFVSGHGTNVSAIADLVGPADIIFHDAYIHNSALLGARLSGAHCIAFAHNSATDLELQLRRHRDGHRRALILVEGVYSMDGDVCDLPRISACKHAFDATLMVDDAHSLGVLGRTGRGTRDHFDLAADVVDLWMGTLSKALASCGGFIAGPRPLVEPLRYFTSGFMFSVGIAPSAAAAALAALHLLRQEPDRAARARARAESFRDRARARGWNIGPSADSAIVPLIVRNSEKALRLAAALHEAGFNVQPIVFPGVAHRQARLRFFFCCDHTENEIDDLVAALTRALARLP